MTQPTEQTEWLESFREMCKEFADAFDIKYDEGIKLKDNGFVQFKTLDKWGDNRVTISFERSFIMRWFDNMQSLQSQHERELAVAGVNGMLATLNRLRQEEAQGHSGLFMIDDLMKEAQAEKEKLLKGDNHD